jgi:hypothetical protein
MQPKCFGTQQPIAPIDWRGKRSLAGLSPHEITGKGIERISYASLDSASRLTDRGRCRFLFEASHATPEKLATIVVTIQ